MKKTLLLISMIILYSSDSKSSVHELFPSVKKDPVSKFLCSDFIQLTQKKDVHNLQGNDFIIRRAKDEFDRGLAYLKGDFDLELTPDSDHIVFKRKGHKDVFFNETLMVNLPFQALKGRPKNKQKNNINGNLVSNYQLYSLSHDKSILIVMANEASALSACYSDELWEDDALNKKHLNILINIALYTESQQMSNQIHIEDELGRDAQTIELGLGLFELMDEKRQISHLQSAFALSAVTFFTGKALFKNKTMRSLITKIRKVKPIGIVLMLYSQKSFANEKEELDSFLESTSLFNELNKEQKAELLLKDDALFKFYLELSRDVLFHFKLSKK